MNGIIKIISKVLSSRLASKLDKLIAATQFAFIQKRNLADNFAAAKGIISHAAQSKHKGILYKLDFEKVFDNVTWSFLLDLLKARGLGNKWYKWTVDIISTAKSSIMVNRTLGKPFKHNRGLHQGDPLSPQLFILMVDSPDQILKSTAMQCMIESIGGREILGQFQNL